jgi:hypothetical protein
MVRSGTVLLMKFMLAGLHNLVKDEKIAKINELSVNMIAFICPVLGFFV